MSSLCTIQSKANFSSFANRKDLKRLNAFFPPICTFFHRAMEQENVKENKIRCAAFFLHTKRRQENETLNMKMKTISMQRERKEKNQFHFQ